MDKCPDQLKLPFALWNRRAIQALIKVQFNIELPTRTINHYLKRWGFTPQKPFRKAYEQNPKAVKKWLDEQIRHEDRQRQHREDVARLHRQIQDLQPEPRKHTHFYERGLQWLSHTLLRHSTSVKKAGKTRLSKHTTASSRPMAVYSSAK